MLELSKLPEIMELHDGQAYFFALPVRRHGCYITACIHVSLHLVCFLMAGFIYVQAIVRKVLTETFVLCRLELVLSARSRFEAM